MARKQTRIRQDFPFAAIPTAFLLESEKQRRQGFLSPLLALRAGVKWICTEYNSIVIQLPRTYQEMSAMPAASTSDVIATIVFWAVMVPISGYIFQNVCSMCGADFPSFRRAVLITVLVTAAAFFTFDGIGYGIIMASRDTIKLNLPPEYHYGNWLREPLYLKWQVLGLIPLIGRLLPVLVAVCLAATLYVLTLAEPFRNCIAILAIQWTVNVVVMAVLSFALSNIIRFVGPSPPSTTAPAASQRPGVSQVSPQARAATRPKPRRGQQKPRREMAQKKSEEEAGSATTASDLKSALAAHEGATGESQGRLRQQLHALEERLEPYIEPIKDDAAPYTQHLPPAVQEFLDDGGWWLVLLALIVVAGLWLRALWRRVRRILFPRRHRGRRHPHDKESPLVIDLDLVGDAFMDPGPQQITVRGQPGRLRLVILAPSPSYVGELLPEMADSLLDWLHPGLAEILESDKPRQVVWPRHPSLDRFVQTFHKLVQIPEEKGRRTPWILISGSAHLGRQTVFVGLAVFLDKTDYKREIQVAREKWDQVIGLQKVTEPV
jgi:hypothetical protein